MYVESFVLPVKTARKAEYAQMARDFATIYCDFGARRVVECWADDVPVGEATSFPRAIQLEADETAVVSWIEYPDRATRDACHKRVFSDPRTKAIEMEGVFDSKRMIFGGYDVMLDHHRTVETL